VATTSAAMSRTSSRLGGRALATEGGLGLVLTCCHGDTRAETRTLLLRRGAEAATVYQLLGQPRYVV
jgi:hypothetical protein